jgi:uncharacterized protein YecE (DUF72 family)
VKNGKFHIGTSGWHYHHWIGTFYPETLKANEQLDYYLIFFDTVEINNSFYRLPSCDTFTKWNENTPETFQFSVKASRYITHMKKLKDAGDSINLLLNNVSCLNKKLGPILFQLPPAWKLNLDRFEEFLNELPGDQLFVFEFREPSWYSERVYELLAKHNCAFCIYELGGHLSPVITTANFSYVRLHGPGNKYQGSYTPEALQQWANQLLRWSDEGKDSYVYFDNDQLGFAAFNALALKEMVGR